MKHWIDITTTDGARIASTVSEGGAEDAAAALQEILDDGGEGSLRIETGDDTWVVLRWGEIARFAVNGISEEVNR